VTEMNLQPEPALCIKVASLASATAPSFTYLISLEPCSSLTVQRSHCGTVTHQNPYAVVSHSQTQLLPSFSCYSPNVPLPSLRHTPRHDRNLDKMMHLASPLADHIALTDSENSVFWFGHRLPNF